MSYIDSYNHVLVGYFGQRPVYQVLEELPGGPSDLDFACPEYGLVIGGGSGELPGLVVARPEAIVARFIKVSVERGYAEIEGQKAKWLYYAEEHLCDAEKCFVFAGWSEEEYSDFEAECREHLMYDLLPEEDGSLLHRWLACSIGEFIFFAMPWLAPEMISSLGEEPQACFSHSRFNNILLSPPGIPLYANHGNAWQITPKFERGKKEGS